MAWETCKQVELVPASRATLLRSGRIRAFFTCWYLGSTTLSSLLYGLLVPHALLVRISPALGLAYGYSALLPGFLLAVVTQTYRLRSSGTLLYNVLGVASDSIKAVACLLRKERDSNPRSVLPLASLAVRCFRPLSHPSESDLFSRTSHKEF